MSSYYQNNINKQLGRIDTIRNILVKFVCSDEIMEHEEELYAAVRQEELLCLEMRNLIRSSGVEPAGIFDERIQDLMGISIRKKGNGIVIALPALRHRNDYRENTAYIITPLFKAVHRFAEKNTVSPFDKARITICHCYLPDVPRNALPDYDNFEIKKVLDVLAMHFLVDDNITRCELLHTSREADRAYTEITIRPMFKNEEEQPVFEVEN